MEAATTTAAPQVPDFGAPWFMFPSLERQLEERGVKGEDAELIRAFARDGYLVLEDLGREDIDSLVSRAVDDCAPLHEGGKYNRVQEAWTVSEAVRELATLPRVLELLRTLYALRPIPFQTLNFLHGSQQLTHPDTYHFHSFPKHHMCGVWIALEDVDEGNGPLHYYPGSHRLPDYDAFGPDEGGMMLEAVGQAILDNRFERRQAHLKRGQALVWAANLLHGGDPVTDLGRTRLSQVTHYYFEGCSYFTPVLTDFRAGRIHWREVREVGSGDLVQRGSGRRSRIPVMRRRPPTYVRYEI